MFKPIPGNYNLLISLNGEIRDSNGDKVNLSIVNNNVEITLYGKNRLVELYWLSLVAFYEIFLPKELEQKLFDIEFLDINVKPCNSQTGKIMVFKKPFLIDKLYRVIPGFTQYCISKNGIIKEIASNEVMRVSNSSLYPTVRIYNPEFSSIKSVMIHRLVALAWISNYSFLDRPIVNHINGNKRDYRSINLEWCSYQENMVHAVNTGLRTDNRSYKVKDHETNAITIYGSFRQVCIAIGLHRDQKFKNKVFKRKNKLINNRYEIKYLEDNSPWFSDMASVEKRGMYETIVTYPDGTVETFHDTKSMMKKLKTWNVSCNIKNVIDKAKIMYPGIKFAIKQNYEIKPVQAYDITNGAIIEAESIREMTRKLEIDYLKIQRAVNENHNRVVNGYVFRFKTDDPWNTNFQTYPSEAKKIKAFNKETNEVIYLDSLRHTSRYLNIERSIIKRCIKNRDEIDNWTFEEVN